VDSLGVERLVGRGKLLAGATSARRRLRLAVDCVAVLQQRAALLQQRATEGSLQAPIV